MSEQPKPTWGRALYLLVMLVIITLLHNYNCNHSAAGAQHPAVAGEEPGRPPEPNGHNKTAMSTEAAPATETPAPAPAETEPKTEEQPAAPPTEPPPAQPE